jgi:phosphoribosylformylglycinamidine synthase subunit PurQ / glutaminase
MKTGVIVFPGSNCDRDMFVVLRDTFGQDPVKIWHKDTTLPDGLDLIAIPGGFSYGDYLRCGALAAQSNIIAPLKDYVQKGGHVLGVCNGFQILLETGLLPGALMRNQHTNFVCKNVLLRIETTNSPFTNLYKNNEIITIPVAHADGNYYASDDILSELEDQDRIAFRYVNVAGVPTPEANFNGSMQNIAGILSENRRVLGMMPHPERMADSALGGVDGKVLFKGLLNKLVGA